MESALILRKNAEKLSAPDVKALRDAFGKMMALPDTDNRSWTYWAGHHGFPRWHCWHHSRLGDGRRMLSYDLFLPWHRAYLLSWEHAARDQNGGAALPWWDWTSAGSHSKGIPAAYQAGANDPLSTGPVPPMQRLAARKTSRQPHATSMLPSKSELDEVLRLTSYLDFSNQVQNLHDRIHGWVDGDMGTVAASAFDPIFLAHHCMIDRIWYLWQLRNGVSNIPPDYMHRTLVPFGMTVADVLDVRRLGYDYAVAVAEAQVPAKPKKKR
jgi:tyrosinase